MCGRFSIMAIAEVLTDRYSVNLGNNVTIDKNVKPEMFFQRYNIAPTQDVPVIMQESSDNISFLRWGLIPHWAKDQKIGYKMINARAESLLEKPSFKVPFQRFRCLVPADGFYEWKKSGDIKTPYRFVLKSAEIFSFAGIYDIWNKEGVEIKSFSIITVEPNSLVKRYHDRMPAILKPEHEKLWLQDLPIQDIQKLLYPYPDIDMKAYEVSKLVNSPKQNLPEMVKPVARQTRLF